MFKCVCLFGLVVTLASAQIPSLGFCPSYTPMEDFDMNRFLGKWYEAERYFTFSDIGSRCVVTDYAKTATGKIYVSNEYTSRLTGVTRVVNGNVQQNQRDGEGKIQVKYTTQPLSSEATLVVLDTDYDSYAVIWSCSGFGLLHAENAWLLTRERLPAQPILQRAYGVLDKFRINRTFFVKTDQEGCHLAASDINAAQGITSVSTVVEQTGEEQRQKAPVKKVVIKPTLEDQSTEENVSQNADVDENNSTETETDTVSDEDDDKRKRRMLDVNS
ncbi:apolipoprotein d [Holotrichia oblita]|uniref:Apolipoprotein d n=1 Tax=Holotrichia oblita TaxID=644536 RepID=A0ACB9TV61_HOLOL|nr:apolipoprotein d [Holotrichia oblita]